MAGSPVRPAELRGLRILLIEDEFLVAMELESMLQDLGGEVIGPIGRLDEAVATAQEEPLDAAVLDVNVGGREVTPVADALAARAIPFVFCTGYDPETLPDRHAAAPILTKPCHIDELERLLLSALRGGTEPGRPSRMPSATGARSGILPTTGAGRARRAGRRPKG